MTEKQRGGALMAALRDRTLAADGYRELAATGYGDE